MDAKMFTLEDALNEGGVFVLNKSNPKGDILITCVQPSSGKNFVATIPKTWIPIAVSDTVPLTVIQDSIDFRSYLKSKILALVPRAEAEKILESTDAKEEVERLYTSKYAEGIVPKTNSKKKQKNFQEGEEVDVQSYIKAESFIVKDIIERNKGEKPSIMLNEFKSIEEELAPKDLLYIVKSTEGKIRTWAEKRLKEVGGTELIDTDLDAASVSEDAEFGEEQ